jgi:hypothetical protein
VEKALLAMVSGVGFWTSGRLTGNSPDRDMRIGNERSACRHNSRIRCVPRKSIAPQAFRSTKSAKDYRAAKVLPRTVE